MKFGKLSVLTLVTAGALAVAGQASAFAPVWPADGDGPVTIVNGVNTNGADPAGSAVLWHSGATASTSSLQTAVVEAFCDAAQPVDILEDARSYTVAPNPGGATDILKAGVAKPDFWSVACIGKPFNATTFPYSSLAGKKILWSKRDEGGSGVGVGPVAAAYPLGFMKPSTGAGNNCPGNDATIRNYPRTVAGVSTTVWNCTGFAVSVVPALSDPLSEASASADGVRRVADIGTSDIEPDKFAPVFIENVSSSDFNLNGTRGEGGDTLTDYDVGTLSKEGMAQLIFNTPVNLLMYQDLQRAQFPDGHPLYNDCNPGSTAGYNTVVTVAPPLVNTNIMGNTEKCMPSLTASEIRAIMGTNGAVRSATDFQAEYTPATGILTYGTGEYTPLSATTIYDVADVAATDNTIQICRRVEGSGTQAQFNAMLLGYPCDPNAADGSVDTLRPEGESLLFTPFVTENESSGDVEKCLNDYNDGTNTNANATNRNTAFRKRWAIGVQSLEKNTPSAVGVYGSRYRFIKIDGFAPTLVNAHAGDYFDVGQQSLQYRTGALPVVVDAFAALKSFIQDPLKLPALNKVHAFGHSGWLASPSATFTPDSKLSLTRPVSWFRRVSFNAGVANTCALPSAFKKTGGSAVTVGPSNCSNNGGADQNCYTP